jgi:hypothetical protein
LWILLEANPTFLGKRYRHSAELDPRPQAAHTRRPPPALKHSRKSRLDPRPQRRLRAIARSALSARAACIWLILAKIDAAPPMPQIEAGDRGDEPIGSSPTRALALRRSALPPARFCLSSRQRARLGSCAIATACKLRPSHAGLHSHYRTARQPSGDRLRRSAPPTSRDDDRWPRAATREPSAAHASHAMLGAARAPRQPAAAKRSTLRARCRRAHAATRGEADASRAPTAIGGAQCLPALPRAQPWPASDRHEPSPSPRRTPSAQTPRHRCTTSHATRHHAR